MTTDGTTRGPRVICVGLNKTATKSLAHCFEAMGYRNQSYCLDCFNLYQQGDWPALYARMDQSDSFEDWPWPLMYEQIDQHYPDARFILTTRTSADAWYRSLCKMAVRMGPLNDFERHIYGHGMPQGHRQEHLNFYHEHNERVREYFKDRPGKLLEVCFDDGFSMKLLTDFLDQPHSSYSLPHVNRSAPVYGGDTLWKAHAHRLVFQARWYSVRWLRMAVQRLKGCVKAGIKDTPR